MEKQEFARLENLLINFSYNDLGPDDKAWVDEEIGGEKAFQSLSEMLLEIKDDKVPLVSDSVKASLMAKFRESNRPKIVTLLSYKAPVYWNVAAILLVGIFMWFLMPSKIQNQVITEFVEIPGNVDTVFIELEPDTIIIESKTYVDRPVYITSYVDREKEETEITIKGTPLIEQSEVRSLINSGIE